MRRPARLKAERDVTHATTSIVTRKPSADPAGFPTHRRPAFPTRRDKVAAQGRLEQIEGPAGGRRKPLADPVARLPGQAAPGAFGVQHPVNRRELGCHDPLLHVLLAGLGGDGTAERLLAQVGDLPGPAGERLAVADYPCEPRVGHEGDVACDDPLGVVTADRCEQALAVRPCGGGIGQAADERLGPVEDQNLLAREVVRHGHLRHPGRDEPAESRAIFELGQALQDAWNRGDAAGYASLFTDDADFVAWNGQHGRGRQAIEDGHRRLFDGPLAGSRMVLVGDDEGSAPTESLRFIRPDVAIMVIPGVVTLAAPSATGPGHQSVQTFVLVKDGDQWRVTAFQNTRQQAQS